MAKKSKKTEPFVSTGLNVRTRLYVCEVNVGRHKINSPGRMFVSLRRNANVASVGSKLSKVPQHFYPEQNHSKARDRFI